MSETERADEQGATTPTAESAEPGYAPLPPAHYPYGNPLPWRPQMEPMAVVALVMAVMGPATCGLSALAGGIIGQTALRKIRDHHGQLEGEGLAKAGMIVGYVVTGLMALFVLAYVGFIVYAVVSNVHHGD